MLLQMERRTVASQENGRKHGARGRHGPLSDGRIARAWYLTVCRRVGEGWEYEIWERVQRD